MKLQTVVALLITSASLAFAQQPTPEPKPETPVLDAAIGPCSANFLVKDANDKRVYAAKIHTLIRYGAFGVKKQELQVSTDYNGEAKITGLPDVNKRPITFDVSKGSATAALVFDPGKECHPHYDVTLK